MTNNNIPRPPMPNIEYTAAIDTLRDKRKKLVSLQVVLAAFKSLRSLSPTQRQQIEMLGAQTDAFVALIDGVLALSDTAGNAAVDDVSDLEYSANTDTDFVDAFLTKARETAEGRQRP